jgi:polyribonucleotide nucleotidyltransferase
MVTEEKGTRMVEKFVVPFGAQELTVEIGKVANQANGAATLQVGGTVVLVAAVVSPEPAESLDFFPLTVDYREKFYASGRIPGGFIKRESRPGESETLRARLIDRPIRPLFPEDFRHEVQVYVVVLSMDQENPAEIPAVIGASIALHISEIPFLKPIAAVRVGRVDGAFIINPTIKEIDKGDLDLIIAGTRDAIIMVEGGAQELPEAVMLDAMKLAQPAIRKLVELQDQIRQKCGKEKMQVEPLTIDPQLIERVKGLVTPHFAELSTVFAKQERGRRYDELVKEIVSQLSEEFPEQEPHIRLTIDRLYERFVREQIIREQHRPDGRGLRDVRPITCETSVLPRTHGSALFTRGQTQALSTVTLGTPDDVQTIDNLMGLSSKHFMLHYNFPRYSVGEVGPIRGPGRREIGHGALAERSLLPVLPSRDDFPYTIRIVSEILESNGSSSMATVSSASLSLMDAGVPIKAPVGGIAMGLVKEDDQSVILTDIIGLEDKIGDMDFKVAGTRKGITALQMDIKIEGIDFDTLARALEQAREARTVVLDRIVETIPAPRPELSPYAPRIIVLQINPSKIGDLIGPAGKVIKGIIEKTGVKIDVEQDGKVYVASTDAAAMQHAIEMINIITAEVELNKIYTGKVIRCAPFGAIVEIFPGQDGLVHISELDTRRVNKTEDVCREGDTLLVKVIDIDEATGRVRLSRKAALYERGEATAPPARQHNPSNRRNRT